MTQSEAQYAVETAPQTGDDLDYQPVIEFWGGRKRGLTPEQYTYLLNPLRSSRVAHRSVGGKRLSYLEAWDVKAHLTRIFGFGNWDSEVVDYGYVTTREYMSNPSKEERDKGKTPIEMAEVIYRARVQLTVRDQHGNQLCRHSEVAVGSTSGPAHMLGEHHDNAVKTAASDALKRCAINLGTQFGLSLYDGGNKDDVVKTTLIKPDGVPTEPALTEEQQATIRQVEERIGAVQADLAAAHAEHSDQAADDAARDEARQEDASAEQVAETLGAPLATDEEVRRGTDSDRPIEPMSAIASANEINDRSDREQAETPAHRALTNGLTRSQAVAKVREAKDALTTEQQEELKTWWGNEPNLPSLTKLNVDQAQLVLARIDLITKQALIASRLGGTEVPSVNESS